MHKKNEGKKPWEKSSGNAILREKGYGVLRKITGNLPKMYANLLHILRARFFNVIFVLSMLIFIVL
jgi:hypothetical protein